MVDCGNLGCKLTALVICPRELVKVLGVAARLVLQQVVLCLQLQRDFLGLLCKEAIESLEVTAVECYDEVLEASLSTSSISA